MRAHKLALQSQRHFWHALLHDSVAFKDLQRAFASMDVAEKQATQVYRRAMERYPGNGKLLKIYGRFLEHVRNDPWSASKYYAEVCVLCALCVLCVLCVLCAACLRATALTRTHKKNTHPTRVRTKRHPPHTQQQQAMKLGLSESLLQLASANGQLNSVTGAMGQVDEKTDGVLIINAVGSIMMLNMGACRMFGYDKGELEGKNVSVLM